MYKPHNDNPSLQSEKVIGIKSIDTVQQSIESAIPLDDEVKLAHYKLQNAQEELKKTKQQKEYLLNNTVTEINNEKQKWESEKEALKEQVMAEAYNEGLELGKQESLSKYKHLLEKANSIIHTAKEDYNKTLDKSEQTIVLLSIKIAEKIMKQTLEKRPEQFLNVVKAAISEIKDQSVISIYLHPENYKKVVEQKDELQTVLNGDTKMSIYIEKGLKENGCIIEHPLGRIDASIDTQLGEVRDILMDISKEYES